MTNITREHLDNLLQQLAKFGEDKFELEMWSRIYDSLSDEEKTELVDNLEQEFNALQAKK